MTQLIENVKMFLKSADLVFQEKDYTSATLLYFKAVFVALDVMILQKEKITPKDHTERFRLLERHHHGEYLLLDKYYIIYRSTYTTTIDEKTCKEIQKYVKQTINKNLGI